MKTSGVEETGRFGKHDARAETRRSRGRETKKTRPESRVLAMQAQAEVGGDGSAVLPYSYCPVAFTLTAPEAKEVYVAGSFNDWDAHCTPLLKGLNGEWSEHLPLKPGKYEYRFVVDGMWKEDPAALASVPNPFGSNNSVVTVRRDHSV
jgi:1,4-alpha-glucan branching enzyme